MLCPDNLFVSRVRTLMEQSVDDELVCLDRLSTNFYGFNAVAARIWALTEQPVSIEVLCARLVEEFDVEPVTCRSETLAMLRELESDGLVALTSAPA